MKSTMRRFIETPYALIGIFFSVLALVNLALQGQKQLIPAAMAFEWQILTGVALLATMLYQWWFLRLRWLGTATRQDLVRHRWSGVLATFLFILHAVRLGHIWMTGLTIVFLLVAVTGILNKEVMRFKTRTAYLIWLTLHISASTMIMPLILVHIWIALAY